MSKISDRLSILRQHGRVLLHRITHAKKVLTTQRPVYFSDKSYARVCEALIKRYPETDASLEKAPGHELVLNKAKQIFEELEPLYYALVDVVEFKDHVNGVFQEASVFLAELSLDINPTLTLGFLECFVIYAQVVLTLSTIDDRRLVMAMFQRVYLHIQRQPEPSYARTANYVGLDSHVKVAQEDLKNLGNLMARALSSIQMAYIKMRTNTSLRKEGTLSLTLKPEQMAYPVTDKFRMQLVHSETLYLSIMYVTLLVPESLGGPGVPELLKFALSEGYVTPVSKGTVLEFHSLMDTSYDKFKSANKQFSSAFSKIRKIPKDALSTVAVDSVPRHRRMRIFLRQELNSLLALVRDTPGLLQPKFPMVLAAISLAREEVLWYFRHLKAPIPKGSSKKVTEEDVRDNRITELLYLIDQLSSLLRTHKRAIQRYYAEYMRGADLARLSDFRPLLAVGSAFAEAVNSILAGLQSVDPAAVAKGKTYDFRVLRLNWARLEATMSSTTCPLPLGPQSGRQQAVDRFNLAVAHTRYVDEFDEVVDECSSLRELWWYREALYDAFSKGVKDGPNQPLHAGSFIRMCQQFPLIGNQYNPQERIEVGQQSVVLADRLLVDITSRVAALLNEIAKSFTEFDNQLQEVNSALGLLMKQPTFKPSKDAQLPPFPGAESEFRKRGLLDRLRLYERNAWQLCAVLNEFDTITVHDVVLHPREYLREKLSENLRKFLRASAVLEIQKDGQRVESMIQRPSVLERQIAVYVSTVKLVENFLDIDMAQAVRQIFLAEAWIPALGAPNTLDYVSVEDIDVKYEGNMIGIFVQWYSDFIIRRLSTPGIVFSPARRGFVSQANVPFRAELTADLCELKAFARMVGPYGVMLVEREVLKFILSACITMKESLNQNKVVLVELAREYTRESACRETLLKLRDSDGFLAKAVSVGNALCFRDILHEALREVVEERTPHLYNVAKSAFNQYRANTYMAVELLPTDLMAANCGVETGLSDQALKRVLSKACTSEAALWDLLPFMFAACFTSNLWKSAVFRPALDGHLNNVHTLAKAINSLIIAFKSISGTGNNEQEISIQLLSFVNVSATILLRMARAPSTEKKGPADFPSIITFMDTFIQASPVLSREVLDANIPYSLLRSYWKQLYANFVPIKGQKKPEGVDQDVF